VAMRMERETPAGETADIRRTADLLGGSQVLHRELRHSLDVDDALSRGLPREALMHVIDRISVLSNRILVERALGISQRTSQRFKSKPNKLLSKEQSSRLWTFAEILAKATQIFGSQEEAERWLQQPAIGLEQRRPIDLLGTPAGVRLVEDFLGRLEYGVYT
jgi:putative toxin-antitoxin system antitoxin component (TIGR02293 family)